MMLNRLHWRYLKATSLPLLYPNSPPLQIHPRFLLEFQMQDQRMQLSHEARAIPKPRKKKPAMQNGPKTQTEGAKMVQQIVKKATKRALKTEPNSLYQQPERSNSDSLADSSVSGDEYRALRRKYLLLEEESFGLGKDLSELEDQVKILEEEKLALLDELVVLEGLIDPSEIQTQTRLS